jgi:hypothetical protein
MTDIKAYRKTFAFANQAHKCKTRHVYSQNTASNIDNRQYGLATSDYTKKNPRDISM